MCSYKKKYKIILCDIIATSVVYLQFRIVLKRREEKQREIKKRNKSKLKFLFSHNQSKFFLHVKTNDSIIDLS